MGVGDALFLAFGLRAAAEAEDVLGQTMHGRGRVSVGLSFLLTTGKCTLGPSDRVSILALDHLRVVEDFSFSVSVTWTQFVELFLAIVSIQRSIAFLIVQYPPELETWIGYGESNAVPTRHVLRFVES